MSDLPPPPTPPSDPAPSGPASSALPPPVSPGQDGLPAGHPGAASVGASGFGPPPTGPVVPVQSGDGRGGGKRPWWKGPIGIVGSLVVAAALIVGGIALTRSDDTKTTEETARPRRTFDDGPAVTAIDRTIAAPSSSSPVTSATDADPGFTVPPLTDPPTTTSDTKPTVATDTSAPASTPGSVAAPGGEVALSGDNGSVRITRVQVVDNAPSLPYLAPDAGNKLIAVQIRVVNSGSALFDQSLTYRSTLIDSQNQQFDSSYRPSTSGPGLSSSAIRPNDVRSGWITFEVPEASTGRRLRIEAFYGADPAQWDLTATAVTPADAPAVVAADVAFNTPATLDLGDGNSIAVTATKVVDPADPEFGDNDPGTRMVSVQVSVTNNGPEAFSDTPDSLMTLIDSTGQGYSTDFSGSKAGPGFDGVVDLAAGETRVGFVSFVVPADAQVVKLVAGSYANTSVELALA